MNHIFWELGFRPFFLFGSLWVVLAASLWLSSLLGFSHFDFLWHGHEMIFGFGGAILAGFLLTATQNWTGIRGIHGGQLQLIVLVWTLGRVESLLGLDFFGLLFLPLLIYLLIPYLKLPSQRKNWILFALIVILWLSEFLYATHLWTSHSASHPRKALALATYVFLTLLTLIGGRVLPYFSRQALTAWKGLSLNWLDHLCVVLTLILGLLLFIPNSDFLLGWLALVNAFSHMVRWLLWRPWSSWRVPILWILYVGYLWIPVGFALHGLSFWIPTLYSAALHSFTTGAIGIFIYGMITRVTFGHTGRKISAPKFIVLLGYLPITLAALLRVLLPLVNSSYYRIALVSSLLLWIFAHLAFVIGYGPILISPSLDGKAQTNNRS